MKRSNRETLVYCRSCKIVLFATSKQMNLEATLQHYVSSHSQAKHVLARGRTTWANYRITAPQQDSKHTYNQVAMEIDDAA